MTSPNRLYRAAAVLQGLLRLMLDALYPPSCPSCRARVDAEGNFCSSCFARVRFITDPLCACCGVPFPFTIEPGARCAVCLDTPPAYSQARAALVYDAITAPLISQLKFNDQWAALDRHAEWMQRAGGELLQGADILIPVPLHWRRLVRRKYNQSALLAYTLSKRSSIVCHTHLLKRVRYTTPQMRLDRRTRLRNVKRAFAVSNQAATLLKDKIIVLIDDVVTTGATAEACTRTLRQAGAKEVRVLSLARTVRE